MTKHDLCKYDQMTKQQLASHLTKERNLVDHLEIIAKWMKTSGGIENIQEKSICHKNNYYTAIII